MTSSKTLTIRGQFIRDARGAIASIRAIVIDAGIGGFGYGAEEGVWRVAADFAEDWGNPAGLETAVRQIGRRRGRRDLGL